MPTINTLAKLSMQLGECPRWNDVDKAWYWVDILGKALYRYDTITKQILSRNFDFQPACFAFTQSNQIILTSSSGVFFLQDFSSPTLFLLDPESDQPLQRFNDGVVTPTGDLLAGTIGDESAPTGVLYYFDLCNEKITYEAVLDGFTIVNGQAFSGDGKWLYITDTPTRTILKYPFDVNTKQLGNAQLFYQFTEEDGYPDGASIDADGNYWVAMFSTGKICVISPEGGKINEIFLPVSQPTMIAFGGENLDKLIVTSAAKGLTEEDLKKQPLAGSVLILDVTQKGPIPARLNSYHFSE